MTTTPPIKPQSLPDLTAFPMVERFRRNKWSALRKRMDQMQPGEAFTVPRAKAAHATTTIARLREAYENTRLYRSRTVDGRRLEIRRFL